MAYGAEARDHKVGRRGGAARKSASRSRTHAWWGFGAPSPTSAPGAGVAWGETPGPLPARSERARGGAAPPPKPVIERGRRFLGACGFLMANAPASRNRSVYPERASRAYAPLSVTCARKSTLHSVFVRRPCARTRPTPSGRALRYGAVRSGWVGFGPVPGEVG
jgi:hypothetical protein